MAYLKLALDPTTYQRLVQRAVAERRPIVWQAEVELQRALARREEGTTMAQGMVRLAADFGAGDGSGGGVDFADLDGKLAEAQAQLGNPPDGMRFQRPALSATKATWVAWSDHVRERAGIAWEFIQQARDACPKVEPPVVVPPPARRISCVIGTYAGHGLAVDAYGGWTEDQVNWGPHHGLPLVAPADGRIEVYQFGTPLSQVMAQGEVYAANYVALFKDWVCLADPLQTMYVAVFWPSAPLVIEGQRVGHLHYGHDRSDIRAGPITQGTQFGTTWDSGIHWEPRINARAAHTHCCAGAGTALSPNGDLPGRLAAVAQGWAVTDIGTVPGPQDYETGRYCAGRLLSDFTAAGRPIPLMPA